MMIIMIIMVIMMKRRKGTGNPTAEVTMFRNFGCSQYAQYTQHTQEPTAANSRSYIKAEQSFHSAIIYT